MIQEICVHKDLKCIAKSLGSALDAGSNKYGESLTESSQLIFDAAEPYSRCGVFDPLSY